MSLAIALANQHGIVMSADKRVTLTVTNTESGESDSFVATDNEQKIFVTKSGHGIAYAGNSVLKDGSCTSEIIETKIRDMQPKKIKEELYVIMNELMEHDKEATVFLIIAGIEDSKRHIYSMNSIANTIIENTDVKGLGYTYLGEPKLASEIIDMVKHDRNNLPLQDIINYLRFVNYTIAKIQYYGTINQTVSEDCNILDIRNDTSTWQYSPYILQ